MLALSSIGEQIAIKRKEPASDAACTCTRKPKSGSPRSTRWRTDAPGELGFSKITKVLSALGLELKLQEASSRRPTLDELMEEDRDDQGLDRRR